MILVAEVAVGPDEVADQRHPLVPLHVRLGDDAEAALVVLL